VKRLLARSRANREEALRELNGDDNPPSRHEDRVSASSPQRAAIAVALGGVAA
jgi:hypothetical protein